jgi:hypothetical protein
MNPEEKNFIFYNLSLEIKRLRNMVYGLDSKLNKTENEIQDVKKLNHRIEILEKRLNALIK